MEVAGTRSEDVEKNSGPAQRDGGRRRTEREARNYYLVALAQFEQQRTQFECMRARGGQQSMRGSGDRLERCSRGLGETSVTVNVVGLQNRCQIRQFVRCQIGAGEDDRSEERRVGKEWVSKCSTRWGPIHTKKIHTSKRK